MQLVDQNGEVVYERYAKESPVVDFTDIDGNPLPTPTQQHAKAECDINNILRQYDRTGLITHINTATAQYGDFTEVNEYQESLNMVMNAQEAFMALPSAIRKQFENDPGQFFEFATNPENQDAILFTPMKFIKTQQIFELPWFVFFKCFIYPITVGL